MSTSLVVTGATIIDGVRESSLVDHSIILERGRIKAIIPDASISADVGRNIIDARGKFVIPGLMDANVHLFMAISTERLARHINEYDDVVVEAAQVALKNGLTTVFDTWGPR